MNKEEILQRSRSENKQKGDERERKIRESSFKVCFLVGGILCIVLGAIENVVFGRSHATLWMIYHGMMFSKFLLDAIKIKGKTEIFGSIVFGIGFISYLGIYILENIG